MLSQIGKAEREKTMPRRGKFKSFLVLFTLVATLLVGVGSVELNSKQNVAHAGGNGQQVALYCDTSQTKVDRIVLSGTNNWGNHSVFDGRPSDASSTWVVWGWWWKGTLEAWWHIPNKGWYYTKTDVPTYYWLDLYTISRCI